MPDIGRRIDFDGVFIVVFDYCGLVHRAVSVLCNENLDPQTLHARGFCDSNRRALSCSSNALFHRTKCGSQAIAASRALISGAQIASDRGLRRQGTNC
ncbi:hypothetical protein BRPE64_ACDS00180 [Caballeronia insecticola]|uniref:Uncharacterized protein n=1 Tax=Caballeronia insecticola TaxID=758793 RepID=R4WV60_9BURK|nr:hypothetical protein BRPE64_ACDS00180 [Caballeronia insecticola]